MRSNLTVLLSAVFLAACSTSGSSKEGGSATATTARPQAPTAAPTITIRQDRDGRSVVDGAPLRGDPKTCATLKRCCANPPSSDFGLMCGMAQAANNGDCAKTLAEVNAYAKESRKPPCK